MWIEVRVYCLWLVYFLLFLLWQNKGLKTWPHSWSWCSQVMVCARVFGRAGKCVCHYCPWWAHISRFWMKHYCPKWVSTRGSLSCVIMSWRDLSRSSPVTHCPKSVGSKNILGSYHTSSHIETLTHFSEILDFHKTQNILWDFLPWRNRGSWNIFVRPLLK